jgi:PAS domain-containing protein
MDNKPTYEQFDKRIKQLESMVATYKTANKKLIESQFKLKDIIDNALAWVWEIDTMGKFKYSNAMVQQILGYQPHEITGKFFYDFFHPK